MKRCYVASGVLLALMLAGCGDENLSAGGASIGGTGGGGLTVGGNGGENGVDQGPNPEVGGPLPIIVSDTVKYINYTSAVEDSCGVVQRSMYLLDNQGQPAGAASALGVYTNQVQLKVELTNTASYAVFEKQPDCHAAFTVQDISEPDKEAVQLKPNQVVSCGGSPVWRVLLPHETQTYVFAVSDGVISGDMTAGHTQLLQVTYSPEFLQQKQGGLPSASADTLHCAPLQLSFSTLNE